MSPPDLGATEDLSGDGGHGGHDSAGCACDFAHSTAAPEALLFFALLGALFALVRASKRRS